MDDNNPIKDQEPGLEEVLDTDDSGLGNLSMVAQFTNFLSKIFNIDEKDKFKYVLDKTRLDENQIVQISYGVYAIKVTVDNDIRTIFDCSKEEILELDKIKLPLYEATIMYMHGRISLHGLQREQLTQMLMPPDLRDKYNEEPTKLSIGERIIGRSAIK